MTSEPDIRWAFPPSNEDARARASNRQRELTKPPGSLGRLEDLVIQMAGWQGAECPAVRPAAAIVFASDHPVTRHGVSAYPASVTRAMVSNFLQAGAAASVACRTLSVPLAVVDVGVEDPDNRWSTTPSVSFLRGDVQRGGDLRLEDALPGDSAINTMQTGADAVERFAAGARVVVLGEMGIGNTTVASALACALLGEPPVALVGRGTGIDRLGWERKCAVVADALARAQPRSALHALRTVGGRDVAALVGAMGRTLEHGAIVLVDGFVVSVAALLLVRLQPAARPGLIFAHRSAEPGHDRVLSAMDARPLLDLGMRLGEASGALAALPLLELACALHSGMATFTSAGVPGAVG